MNNMLFSVFHMRWLIQWIHINITDQEKSVSRCHTKCFVHRTMCSQQFPSAALSPTCHRCFPVKQNREAWGGFDMEGVLRYSTSNVKWSGELGWEAALNSPSGVARLWAQMAPALLWGKQFHPHWGHSSSEQMRLFYCNVLWTEITGECHLAGKQDELDGVMLFGWIYWLCSHGLQNHIFTVLLNTNLVWCYVRWRKAGQEENIWSLITGCDLFSCPLQNFHCFLTMAQAFILLNKHLNLTY